MSSAEILRSNEDKMKKAIEHLKNELRNIRTGRASPAMIENIRIDYYGTPTPLKQAATLALADARTITVKPFDLSILKAIEKAVAEANLGATPSNDGKIVRLSFPPMSEERRKQSAGQVKTVAEQGRVAVRNVRRDAMKHVDDAGKTKTLIEDEVKKLKDQLQDMLKKYEKEIDDIVEKKTAEVMEI